MEVKRIGKRGLLFIFDFGDDTTNIYTINGQKHWFVIDTFLGPGAIIEINTYLKGALDEKPVIVVNTHAHFDHFWGNCAFQSSIIIAHTFCKHGIERRQQVEYLEKNSGYQMGTVEIIPPNVTFEKRIAFEDDNVTLFHSPGHTRDSISCIDYEDQVLFVGDNIGLPIPSIYPGVKVTDFIETLEAYCALALPTIVSSHYNEVENDLIEAHLKYLRKLLDDDTEEYDRGEYKFFNDWNKKMLARPVDEKNV